jgi:hypothetical protein
MRRTVVVLLCGLALAACAGRTRPVAGEGLSVRAEAAFAGVSTVDVSDAEAARLRVRLGAAPAVAARHYAAVAGVHKRAFRPVSAVMIRSDERLLQRIELDAKLPSLQQDFHGPCTQRVALWFVPEGELLGAYAREPVCPL